MHNRHLTALGLSALVLAFAGWVLADRSAKPPAPSNPDRAAPLIVGVGQLKNEQGFAYRRLFTGRVEAARHSALGFELTGRIAQVVVREGDLVQAGQVLARLDTARLDAQFKELKAGLGEARATLELARSTLRRQNNIVERGGVSRQGLDEAREAFQAAKARVTLIQRQLDSVRVELDKTQLRAPYEGIVVARKVHEGRVANAGVVVLELQESAPPVLRVGVAGRLVDELKVGRLYPMQRGRHRFSARLRSLLPVRAATSRTVDALFDPVNTDLALRAGDLVRLRLSEFVAESGVWLPRSALAEGQRGLWNVYIADPTTIPAPADNAATHQLRRRIVEVLYQEADRVYVRGRFSSDDRVVTNGLQRVVPNQYVRVIEANERLAEYSAGGRQDG